MVQTIGRRRIFGAGRIKLTELVVQGLEFLLHLLQVREDAHAFGKDRASRKCETVLRQISLRNSLSEADGAVVQRLHAAQDFQQRSLAGAIRPDQPGALFGRDEPIAVFEQEFMAEALPSARELDHRWASALILADALRKIVLLYRCLPSQLTRPAGAAGL